MASELEVGKIVAKTAATTGSSPLEVARLEVKDEGVNMAVGMGPKLAFYMPHNAASFEGASIAAKKENQSDTNEATSLSFSTIPDAFGAPVERLTIDSTGNVGINTDSIEAGWSTSCAPIFEISGTKPTLILEEPSVGEFSFVTKNGNLYISDEENNAERLTISSTGLATFSGDLECGTVSATGASVGFKSLATTSSSGPNTQTSADNTGTRGHYLFYNPNGEVGSIKTSGSATSFNTSSDYRLKENLTPLTGALDRLDALPVYRFSFKADPDTTVDGFVAHEVQAHVPEAVTGEKDAMKTVVVQEAVEAQPPTYYEEGDELPEGKAVGDEKTPAVEAVEEVTEEQIDPQGIDQSKLVPLLVAAVKELKAKVEALEGGE